MKNISLNRRAFLKTKGAPGAGVAAAFVFGLQACATDSCPPAFNAAAAANNEKQIPSTKRNLDNGQ